MTDPKTDIMDQFLNQTKVWIMDPECDEKYQLLVQKNLALETVIMDHQLPWAGEVLRDQPNSQELLISG